MSTHFPAQLARLREVFEKLRRLPGHREVPEKLIKLEDALGSCYKLVRQTAGTGRWLMMVAFGAIYLWTFWYVRLVRRELRQAGPRRQAIIISAMSLLIVGLAGTVLWFVDNLGNKVGRITTSGQITEFDIPTQGVRAVGITVGADGNMWFTEQLGQSIGRITPPRETSSSLPPGCTPRETRRAARTRCARPWSCPSRRL